VSAPSRLLFSIRQLGTDPAASTARLQRAFAVLRAQVILRGCALGTRVAAFGPVRVRARGEIAIGSKVFFLKGMIPAELSCEAGARLSIGAGTAFNYGVSIEATRQISIGTDCMFGSMVRVSDAGAHGAAPVTIGNNVWLAHGAIVEPGVTIGDGAVVSAGSVVTSDVPPRMLAVGNPARAVPL
jgi:maltose O-acetyltransferase